MPLTLGTRLGSYEVLAPLGVGGMGEVYRARDLRLGRDVAVKVLPAEVASSFDRLARFEREARTVAGLNHPNIVTLHSIEDEDGIRFLTMELVEGQSLSDLITPGGLPVARVLELGVAIANALAAAHECAIVHRDLKPANVMVTREGRVKVLDFGLAKPASAAEPFGSQAPTAVEPQSEAGALIGTVPYMAPEQVKGEAVDARTDLFALGILLYELLAGQRPFAGSSPMVVSAAILRDTPEPLARIRSDLPVELERLVSRCLEKNPLERSQSAVDVSNELRRLRKQLEMGASGLTARPAPETLASIAVLPFLNRSPSADDEYFSDGLADELLGVLSKIKGLRVTARTSSFQFKESKDDVPTIGRKLNVAALLEGSVRKAGNRIRVSVQLVNVADSSHLWSETYDRTLEDIFAVQDDIAHSVVKELRSALLGEADDSDASGEAKGEVARAAKGRGTDPEAHRLYLQARHLIDRFTLVDIEKAIDYLNQALARDSQFALALAELSKAYVWQAQGWTPPVEGFGRAREAVERALTLEPDLAEGHAVMASIQMMYDWDWRGAEASLARALELAPGNVTALRRAGILSLSLGRFEEAIGLCRRAAEQDPLSAAAYFNLARMLHCADRLAEAEVAYRKVLELVPQMPDAHAYLAFALLAQGRGEAALAEAIREPDRALHLDAQAIVHHALGQMAESEAALRELIETRAGDCAYQVAEVHGARGEADAAFEWLERAYAQRDGGLSELKTNPHLRSLHGDPRWGAFLKKMGLED